MRKTIQILLLVLTVLLFITAFVSCRQNEQHAQAAAAKQLSKSFSCNAKVMLDGKEYDVAFSKTSPGMCSLSFSKPPELSSLSFNLGQDGLKIKYDSFEASIDPSSIPESAVFNAFLGAFNTAAGKSGAHAVLRGRNIIVKGSTGTSGFSLTLGSDLTPKELDIPSLNMKVAFSNFKYL